MNKLLLVLGPQILAAAIAMANKNEDKELSEFLKADGAKYLEQFMTGAQAADELEEKVDRAHFVAHLAASLSKGRMVALSEVPQIVTVAYAIAAEALRQCGAPEFAGDVPGTYGAPPEPRAPMAPGTFGQRAPNDTPPLVKDGWRVGRGNLVRPSAPKPAAPPTPPQAPPSSPDAGTTGGTPAA